MKSIFKCCSAASAAISRWLSYPIANFLGVGGRFYVECYKPDGSLRWASWAKNGVVNAGINDLLNVYFRGGTQTTAWYLLLVDNAGFTGFAAGDTMSSHSGWSEMTEYGEANRPQWSPGAPSGQSIVNSTTVNFSITASKTVRGLAVTSNNTKGGTTGLLWATASLTGGTQTVNNGDTLKATYSVSGTSG